MTAPDPMLDLARRAVACRGWRWMPGMLAIEWAAPGMSLTGGRPVRVDDGWHEVGVWLPDLSDPATQGCVMALLDEAYCEWWVEPSPGADMRATRWAVYVWNGSLTRRIATGATRIEALIAALEAKP